VTRALTVCLVLALLPTAAAEAAPSISGSLRFGTNDDGSAARNKLVVDFTIGQGDDAARVEAFPNVSSGPASEITTTGPGGSCFATDEHSGVICNFSPALTPGAGASIAFTLPQNYPAGGGLRLGARAPSGEPGQPVDVPGPAEPSGGGTTPPPSATGADLALDLIGPDGGNGPFAALPGQRVSYTLRVTNVGDSASPGGLAVFQLDGADVDDSRWDTPSCGGHTERLCTMTLFGLAPGESREHPMIAVEILAFFPSLGERTLTASLSRPDGQRGANSDTHVTKFEFGAPRNDSNARCPARSRGTAAKARACVLPRRAARALSGTASGDVAKVEVALVRASGGARTAARRCQWLTTSGRLASRPPRGGRCLTPVWLKASGTRSWKLRLRRPLPAGSYVLYSRAVDAAGAPEAKFSAADRNRLALALR